MSKCRFCQKPSQLRGFYQFCNECAKMVVINARHTQNHTCQSLNCAQYCIAEDLQQFEWLPEGHCIYFISNRGKVMFKKFCARCTTKIRDLEADLFEIETMRVRVRTELEEILPSSSDVILHQEWKFDY
jgi:hypothetical protein